MIYSMALPAKNRVLALSFAALGVVYGDIGTSPLYAIRESLHHIPINSSNVLGVLSLIFWSLILIISLKYIVFILKADNGGEGGILALLALLKRKDEKAYNLFFYIGVLGAGLLLGDGMLTPAISVLSAMEGLEIISPQATPFILPLTIIVLGGLFSFQRLGTEKISHFFSPIILVWFFTLATLGMINILKYPSVLTAINPRYAIEFFKYNGLVGYTLLGGVFLVITGGEALYTDLGHFGKQSIRLSWFVIVLPSLLLNYFGQGAYLIQFPEAIINPFYSLAPSWFSYPLLILATLATVIASQAVISAIFSLVKQAILLNLYPRLSIIQTSKFKKGQIYVPQMNNLLAIGSILLVVIFKNSNALVNAYGIAVNLIMLSVTLMVTYLAYKQWQWSKLKIILIFSVFTSIDLIFLGANLQKMKFGGWIPLSIAIISVLIMISWKKGIEFLRANYYIKKTDLKEIINQFDYFNLNYLPNSTVIFITDAYDRSGGSLLTYLKLTRILPEHVLILSVVIKNQPYIEKKERFKLTEYRKGISQLVLHYGFMDLIDIPQTLMVAQKMDIFSYSFDIEQATFLLENLNVKATIRKKSLPFFWQEKLFAFLMRNAAFDIDFFGLPYQRTLSIGTYFEI
ncbi:MAG: transporter [Francisellaceae bacterium]|nr:transporter [Francisellaceae bacterium]